MEPSVDHIQEQETARAFTKQSSRFDALFSNNPIVQYKRQRVYDHVSNCLPAGSKILELNAGTGDDAVWFARQGHRVHATDISEGMREQFLQKIQRHGIENHVSHELCSFNRLAELRDKGPYDYIFSNFAGLNCTGRLDEVLRDFSALLKPGGLITLVIMPPFCLWELLLVFRGRFKTAFRRLFSSHGAAAVIEGEKFTCWYYKPSYVVNHLKDNFHLLALEGLCTLVPPSFLENFPVKRPRLYQWLKEKEGRWKSSSPWRSVGDYYIITLKKNE